MTHRQWLLERLPRWQREGLLTAEAAETLRVRYGGEDEGGSHLAQLALGLVGALLIGAGLIAIIGYNWDDLPLGARLAVGFVPLALTQLAAYCVLRRGASAPQWWREAAAFLQVCAAGGCVIIVSQVYNMGGEWPEFLFLWLWLMLPVIWALNAHGTVVLYLALSGIWVVHAADRYEHSATNPWWYAAMFAGLIPYLLTLRRRREVIPNIVRWFGVCSLYAGLCSLGYRSQMEQTGSSGGGDSAALWLPMLHAALLTLLPLPAWALRESLARKPQVFLGFLGLLAVGLACTFQEPMRDFSRGVGAAMHLHWTWGVLAVMALFVIAAAIRGRWAVLAVSAVAALPAVAVADPARLDALASWIATGYLFGAGLLLIILDFSGRQGGSRAGAMLMSIVILVRFCDSDFPLLYKGTIFIIVGVAFILFNMMLGRLRQKWRSPAS
jgi:hypothetical protein